MKKVYDDYPGWIFEVREVSAAVYEVVASDLNGRRVARKGTDPHALLDECKQEAAALVRGAVSA